MTVTAPYLSPVGPLTLAAAGGALTGLWLNGQKYDAATLPADAQPDPSDPVLHAAADWLDRYFAGEKPPAAELTLAPSGSGFRQLIWSLLLDIPYGTTTTYGALASEAARRLGLESMSAQAVGGAVGHNPISIIIPCHRVLGSDGSLTGYAGGVDKKRWLLVHEGALR